MTDDDLSEGYSADAGIDRTAPGRSHSYSRPPRFTHWLAIHYPLSPLLAPGYALPDSDLLGRLEMALERAEASFRLHRRLAIRHDEWRTQVRTWTDDNE